MTKLTLNLTITSDRSEGFLRNVWAYSYNGQPVSRRWAEMMIDRKRASVIRS